MVDLPASCLDILTAPRVAILTTNGTTGFPQSTAVAFLLDDDGVLKISLNQARQKTKNLRRDPKCTLFFIDPANQYRTLEVRALAHLTADVDKTFAVKAGAKYGTDFRENDRPGEDRVIVVLEPVQVNANGT